MGLADGSLDLVATDHVPDRVGVEKAEAASGVSFDKISNGAPGIETLLALVYSEGVARGRLTIERMVDVLATTPAARFGLARKGAIEVGRDADIVDLRPGRHGERSAPTDLHHTSDYTPYEGLEVRGAVRDVARARRRRHPRRRLRRPPRRRAVHRARPDLRLTSGEGRRGGDRTERLERCTFPASGTTFPG